MSMSIPRMSAGLTVLVLTTVTTIGSAHLPALNDDAPADDLTITVFDNVAIEWDEQAAEAPEPEVRNGVTVRRGGQVIERTLQLPPMPENQRDARRITGLVEVKPRLVSTGDGYRPGDPWPRLGAVSVAESTDGGELVETELMRFVTGFGGASTFRANLTSMAPLLSGETTMRVYLSTWNSPGWDVTLTLQYDREGVGYRRPIFAERVFFEEEVTADSNVLRTSLTIPGGVDQPRIRILSTGHATDGAGGDEFITRTHILRVDGEEVARWRPWAEDGGRWRPANPTSGRFEVDGRELWSSDLDRSGWHPGRVVWPLRMPLPELTTGRHEIELQILGIRPADPPPTEDEPGGDYGYWRVSAIILADEPWPLEDASTPAEDDPD